MNENENKDFQQSAPQPAPQPMQQAVPQPYPPYYGANNGMYYNTFPQTKPVEKVVFSKREKILSFAAALLSFLFVHFVMWHSKSFFTTVFYIILFAAVIIYLRKSEYRFSPSHKLWTGIMLAFSLVFSLTDNTFIKVLDTVFLHLGCCYLIYTVTAQKPMFGRFTLFEMLKCNFENPFSHFSKEYSAANSAVQSTRTGSNAKAVIIGFLIALPLTIVVGTLLVSADRGVELMLNSLTELINVNNVFNFVVQAAMSIPVSGYIFGLIYSHTHPEKIKALDEEKCVQSTKKMRIAANLAVYSAVTPICLLYVLFFISQANYFLSAFMGSLPENYSYAEYARRGFFELFAIDLINAGVIFFINFFSKKTGEEKPFTLKLYTVIISVFTLLITATAISKMVLYIQNFGLTQLRVYTTWFMALTSLMFIFVIIRQFRTGFPFMKAAAVVFTLFFAVLCFSRPDALIARYNMEFCPDQMTYGDIREMTELSADAAAVVLEPQYRDLINEKYNDIRHYCDTDNVNDSGYKQLADKAKQYLDYDYNIFNLSSLALGSTIRQ